jgi:hypothetical protein
MAAPSNLDRDLGRVEGKVDSILVSMSELKLLIGAQDQAQSSRTEKLEKRVSALEKSQYMLAGAGALGGSLVGWSLPSLIRYLTS